MTGIHAKLRNGFLYTTVANIYWKRAAYCRLVFTITEMIFNVYRGGRWITFKLIILIIYCNSPLGEEF